MQATEQSGSRQVVWLYRLLLATLLLFGSEILLWLNPFHRSLVEWLLLIPGYIVVATLLLDLAVRFRLRNLYDIMVLLTIYGVCTSLFLNPETALFNFPRTLVTRVLGAHSLLGLEMFGLFILLSNGQVARFRWLSVAISLWVGFYWGTWLRWLPVLTTVVPEPVSLTTMLLAAGIPLVITMLLFRIASSRGRALQASDFQLPRYDFGVMLLILVALFVIRLVQGVLGVGEILILAVLLGLALGTLWFRHSHRGIMLMEKHFPPKPLAWRWLVLTLLTFILMTVFAYQLPLVEINEFNQFLLMELGYLAVGFVWLPLVAMVISTRAISQQSRTHQAL